MRFLPALAALLLVGCPAGDQPPESAEASPTPTPESITIAPATPSAEKAAPTESVKYEGTWSTFDAQGQPFDIVIFPNQQAVTTWTKGTSGAKGERGFWRQEQDRVVVIYDDGWTDILSTAPDGTFHHAGYAPGTSLDGPPNNTSAVTRVDAPMATFVGVWRLNKEPDGTYLYVNLQSTGMAVSTINGATEGHWTVQDNTAISTWPDGWVDVIERSAEGWQKRSRVGTAEDTSVPADFSRAVRVGETPFVITP